MENNETKICENGIHESIVCRGYGRRKDGLHLRFYCNRCNHVWLGERVEESDRVDKRFRVN